jgi:hypothetical protein
MISSLIVPIVPQLHLQIHPSFIGAVCLVPFDLALGLQTRLDHHLANPDTGISGYVL